MSLTLLVQAYLVVALPVTIGIATYEHYTTPHHPERVLTGFISLVGGIAWPILAVVLTIVGIILAVAVLFVAVTSAVSLTGARLAEWLDACCRPLVTDGGTRAPLQDRDIDDEHGGPAVGDASDTPLETDDGELVCPACGGAVAANETGTTLACTDCDWSTPI
jgi:hypothetical protein